MTRPRGRPRVYDQAVKTSYRLDVETVTRLERLAAELGVSRAEVIRRAVREMAERGSGAAPA